MAYLFADALELRRRAAQSGISTDRYRDLTGRELRLVIERPGGWEYLLFSEALKREMASSADLKRDWSQRILLVPSESSAVTPAKYVEYSLRKIDEGTRLTANLNVLFNETLKSAFGPPGQAGDWQAIIYVANRVGETYRAILRWKLNFLSVSVSEQLLGLRYSTARMYDNVVSEIEAFNEEQLIRISEAMNAPPGDPKRTMKLQLTLTIPDLTKMNHEIEHIKTLIRNGELNWQ